jgi:CBS domain-containing protein
MDTSTRMDVEVKEEEVRQTKEVVALETSSFPNPNDIPVKFTTADSIRLFLSSVPVMSIPREMNQVVCLKTCDTAVTALSVFHTYGLQSCPVWDPELEAITGVLSVHDLVALILEIADKVCPEFKPNIEEERLEDAVCLVQMQEIWKQQSAFPVANMSNRNPVVPLNYDASMWDVIRLLALEGYHSVLIRARDGDGLSAVISQSLVAKFLFQHLDKFPTVANKTVHQVLQLGRMPSPEVVHVMEDELTIEAFRRIVQYKVSGIAVVNHHRQIVGVISASDIQQIAPDACLNVLLYISAGKFIKRCQGLRPLVLEPVVSVTPVDTLGIVMEKLVDNRIHRVFVVRTHHGLEQNVLVDVISLRDVLLQFCPYQEEKPEIVT